MLADSGVVPTIVFFHAHPDDEVISTGGSSARAAAEGHRTVLVVATNGDFGEAPDDFADGETLVDRRRAECEASAAILGFSRVVWLGYRDSGMTGWEANDDPESFWRAGVDEAGAQLAAVLVEEGADVLVAYDWHGNYGHPDHVQVHRVGHRAAVLAGTPVVYEATFNRDLMIEAFNDGAMDFDPETGGDDGNPVGTPAAEINLRVDVTDFVEHKRRALACHASQVTDAGGMLAMPPDLFALAFGTEWFIRPDQPTIDGPTDGWLL